MGVREDSPENIFQDPNDFYTEEEANRYNQNNNMKKIQQELTKISLELSKPISDKKSINILDVGCGTGFSLELLKELGYLNIKGIDPSKEMISLAKVKKLDVKIGGFEDLSKINEKFDLIISISAFQWILSKKKEIEVKNIVKKVGKNLEKLLLKKGVCIIQFYPSCIQGLLEKEVLKVIESSFKRVGFLVDIFIYKEESVKKRKIFFILRKFNF